MEIVITTPKVYLKDIKEGTIFMTANGILYVKMNRVGQYNATRLHDGELVYFDDEQVIREAKKVEVIF